MCSNVPPPWGQHPVKHAPGTLAQPGRIPAPHSWAQGGGVSIRRTVFLSIRFIKSLKQRVAQGSAAESQPDTVVTGQHTGKGAFAPTCIPMMA